MLWYCPSIYFGRKRGRERKTWKNLSLIFLFIAYWFGRKLKSNLEELFFFFFKFCFWFILFMLLADKYWNLKFPSSFPWSIQVNGQMENCTSYLRSREKIRKIFLTEKWIFFCYLVAWFSLLLLLYWRFHLTPPPFKEYVVLPYFSFHFFSYPIYCNCR